MKPLRAILFATVLALTAQCFAAPAFILLQPKEDLETVYSATSNHTHYCSFHKVSKELYPKSKRSRQHKLLKLQVFQIKDQQLSMLSFRLNNNNIDPFILLPDPDLQLLKGPPKF